MNKNFNVGDIVAICIRTDDPKKYKRGEVVRVGAWGVVDVQFCGLSHPIGMKSCEIEKIS